VHRNQRNRFLLGIGATFDLSDRLFPICPHVPRECAQSAHIVGAGHFEEEIDVGDGALRARLEALPHSAKHTPYLSATGTTPTWNLTRGPTRARAL
jgi:hypothetical protein